ncbi:glycosyltransferase family 4 protein [Motilibacter aurantiacus]|uniref:glycosyltransferase family 4 protein n=1 Tax=Motilibacter aurantiacus TaxID=2714955 RepID=UPI00140E9120|nr:glycosyltransferase family 4 protein [Motilibacter aurantiacus]NHC44736.1 glycosyltransferase family 4 protein [Motilibacter aurantiacus]
MWRRSRAAAAPGGKRRFRLLIARAELDYDRDAVARALLELAQWMRGQGHEVTLLRLAGHAPEDGTERAGLGEWLIPARRTASHRGQKVLNLWYLLASGVVVTLRRRRFDTILTVDTPTGVELLGLLAKRVAGPDVRHVTWVLDLWADQERALELRSDGGSLLARARTRVDNLGGNSSDVVVTLGSCMREALIRRGVSSSVEVIPMWQKKERLARVDDGALRRRLGLGDRFVVLYSGHATHRHPLQAFVGAAELLRDDPRVLFALAGTGDRIEQVRRQAAAAGLANLRVLPRVPESEVAALLSSGGLHVVSLDLRATGTCVPSKTYAAMAVARPVAFLGSPECQSALDVTAGGGGLVLDPDDSEGLAAFVRKLLDGPEAEAYGRRGLEFFLAERELDIAGRRWLDVLRPAKA